MGTIPEASVPGGATSGFEIRYCGRAVDVVFQPPLGAGAPPTLAAVLSALRNTPLELVDRARIEQALDELPDRDSELRVRAGEVRAPPRLGDPCFIKLSPDGLAAYAIPLDPATEEPPTVTAGLLRSLIEEARVTVGVLDDVVEGFGAGEPLRHAICIARGEPPIPGRDAGIQWHIDPDPDPVPIEREDGSVDYHELAGQRFVQQGDVLVTRTPPVIGTSGRDVTGHMIEVAPARDTALKSLSGRNTEVRDEQLIATIPGRPLIAGGKIEILPTFEVQRDLDYGTGNIDFVGDVVIRGDVRPGFTVVAGGSVVIHGLVEGASVRAGGDITVSGIVGSHESVLEAGGNLIAQYLHTATVHAGGAVRVRREIMNCRVEAERVETGSSGRIVGGMLTAKRSVDTGTLGSQSGMPTEVCVSSREREAVVRARRQVHPGVVVRVGVAQRRLNDGLEGASFWSVGGRVVSLKPTADERELSDQGDAAA